LLDHNLPDLPGTEAIKRIKAEVPDTKVVMVTGSDEDSVLLDAVVAGCSGFVSKASTPSEVVNAIRSAVSGETVLPERIVRLIPRLSARPAHDLTPREIEILHYLVSGSSNRQIAQELFISLNTVRNHVQHVIEKLGAHTKLEAVTIAIRERIVRLASQS
jgi:DNA-binding NarL/FixJ family response regulator